MIRAIVTTPDDVLGAIADTAQKSPKLMRTAFTRNVRRLASRYLKRLKYKPPKWHGKRRWKSERQQRAYYATDGFGAGIPYVRRTPGVTDKWEVVFESGGPYSGAFAFENNDPVARWTQGDDAQPMHLDSGYTQLSTVVSEARPEIEEVAIQTWYTVSDPFAGARG